MLPLELTVTEAMKFSGFSRVHIYNLITAERIKSRRAKMRTGPIVFLIDRASLEAYIEWQRQRRSVNAEAN